MAVRKIPPVQEHLRILGDDEIDALYGRPRFTPEERWEYFALAPPEQAALAELHSVKSQLCFILQLGYFKARQLFFTLPWQAVKDDAQHLQERYFPAYPIADTDLSKVTRLKHQRLIRELFRYQPCDARGRQRLAAKAAATAAISCKPIYVFRALLHDLQDNRIVLPGYRVLQETVSQALGEEHHRLIALMRAQLSAPDIEALRSLLADVPGLYELTQLKREPRDFSAGEIKRERRRGQRLQPLYRLAQHLLPHLGISNESIKYYASLVSYYSVYKIKRLNQWLVYVYLVCFAWHRYQRLHDNLIASFLYHVRRFGEEAKAAARERVYECAVEGHQNLKKAGRVLKLFTDDSIGADTPFHDVQDTAFAILARPTLAVVADQIASNATVDEAAFQWAHLETLAAQFKRHLRPILLEVDFAAVKTDAPLLEAVARLKTAFRAGRPLSQAMATLPTQRIPKDMKRYLYAQEAGAAKSLQVDRYEFWIYRQLRNGLEAGDIFCRDSVRFRSFEDDLLDDERWRNKAQLIADAGLPILGQSIRAHLAELGERLEARIQDVNRRIAAGENEHLELKPQGRKRRWTLQYPRGAEAVNHAFFDALKQVDIASVLHFVNQHCRFIDAFEHVLGRYAKQSLNDRVLVACLIAWGTNLGLGRMGEISDIGYAQLTAVSDSLCPYGEIAQLRDFDMVYCRQ